MIAFEQSLKVAGHALDPVTVEEVSAVLDVADNLPSRS